jgi:hypothetical protein
VAICTYTSDFAKPPSPLSPRPPPDPPRPPRAWSRPALPTLIPSPLLPAPLPGSAPSGPSVQAVPRPLGPPVQTASPPRTAPLRVARLLSLGRGSQASAHHPSSRHGHRARAWEVAGGRRGSRGGRRGCTGAQDLRRPFLCLYCAVLLTLVHECVVLTVVMLKCLNMCNVNSMI